MTLNNLTPGTYEVLVRITISMAKHPLQKDRGGCIVNVFGPSNESITHAALVGHAVAYTRTENRIISITVPPGATSAELLRYEPQISFSTGDGLVVAHASVTVVGMVGSISTISTVNKPRESHEIVGDILDSGFIEPPVPTFD